VSHGEVQRQALPTNLSGDQLVSNASAKSALPRASCSFIFCPFSANPHSPPGVPTLTPGGEGGGFYRTPGGKGRG